MNVASWDLNLDSPNSKPFPFLHNSTQMFISPREKTGRKQTTKETNNKRVTHFPSKMVSKTSVNH